MKFLSKICSCFGEKKGEKCMACECPCEEHKEHNHAGGKEKCSSCGEEHEKDKKCERC